MPEFSTWEDAARSQGWVEVEFDPRPEWAKEDGYKPCLYNEDQERSWPLGDWEGAARDVGIEPHEVKNA